MSRHREQLSGKRRTLIFSSTHASPASGYGALGIFNLHVDPLNLSAELTSLRSSSLQDVLEVVDITNFLRMAPCTNCVKLRSVSFNPDGNPVVTIGIKHPFKAGDPLKPISGQNRSGLHVFNVEGIVVSSTDGLTFPGLGMSTPGFRLLNADGYTPYLDEVLEEILPTAATIHPYVTYFDDYSTKVLARTVMTWDVTAETIRSRINRQSYQQ